jgi:FkbM family methyltransferase
MKRGAWTLNLLHQILRGDLSFIDGLSFGLARIRPKPVSISLHGIRFDEVDHTFWGVLVDIFLKRVYLPAHFTICPDDIVVDIGAHRGGFTTFAAQRTSNEVIAFEPDPVNFCRLQKHIEQNNLQNVFAHNAAIGGQTGKSSLFLAPSSSGHSSHKSQVGTHNNAMRQIEVNVVSLDEALAPLDQVHFLKMDCEGAEFDILMHAKGETLDKIEKLAMETHDPIQSQKIRQLCDRLGQYFPHLELVDQEQENLGYLYGWK